MQQHDRSGELQSRFASRLLASLDHNNVLRGAWAEELVASYLGAETWFPPQWSYFDLRWNGATVSVKHSVGGKARFPVGPSAMVWDCELAAQRAMDPSKPEGWRGHQQRQPQYWCDVYAFAHLPAPLTLARVLDPAVWRFAVLSRSAMHASFGGGLTRSRSATLRTLSSAGAEFCEGARLIHAAQTARADRRPEVPEIDWRTREDIVEELNAKTVCDRADTLDVRSVVGLSGVALGGDA